MYSFFLLGTGATCITVSPLSLYTGGISDDPCNNGCEHPDADHVPCEVVNGNRINGHASDLEDDVEGLDEEEFLDLILPVSSLGIFYPNTIGRSEVVSVCTFRTGNYRSV